MAVWQTRSNAVWATVVEVGSHQNHVASAPSVRVGSAAVSGHHDIGEDPRAAGLAVGQRVWITLRPGPQVIPWWSAMGRRVAVSLLAGLAALLVLAFFFGLAAVVAALGVGAVRDHWQ